MLPLKNKFTVSSRGVYHWRSHYSYLIGAYTPLAFTVTFLLSGITGGVLCHEKQVSHHSYEWWLEIQCQMACCRIIRFWKTTDEITRSFPIYNIIYKIRTYPPAGMCLDFLSKTSSADACGCCPRRGANVHSLAGPGCYRSTGQAESPVTLISWDGGRKKISIRKVAFRCGIIRDTDELFFKPGRHICTIWHQNLQTFASL